MRDALKKAQQELGKQPPGPPGSPNNDPQLQKLLDEIAELKMIRELQKQVNARTKRYGDKHADGGANRRAADQEGIEGPRRASGEDRDDGEHPGDEEESVSGIPALVPALSVGPEQLCLADR